MKTGLVYDPLYREHRPRVGHPESPERCDAVLSGISQAVPDDSLLPLSPRAASDAEVCLCHTRKYLDIVKEDVRTGEFMLSTGDTDISEKTLDAALLAAGGALTAVDSVMDGTTRNAFCVVRPPGHHATIERGMGFCVFNNAAIAARYAQRAHGIERVLIADWDLHHGNGTQDIFYDDPSVVYFSTHQWPCYPGSGSAHETGSGEGKGLTVNCPFPMGSGSTEVMGAFREKLVPSMRKFRPEMIVISAGFDSRGGDPLGHFLLSDSDFAELTRVLMDIADEFAGGRIVSVLEGGYDLAGLASAAGAHVRTLAKADFGVDRDMGMG